jgi:hypothetical protein
MFKVLLLFPNNATALQLASRLIKGGHSVTFYVPGRNDQTLSEDSITELQILAQQHRNLCGDESENSFSVITEPEFGNPNFDLFDAVGKGLLVI